MEVLNRTLQRGLAILELLADAPQGMTLGQVAAHLDLPKSSAFNLLHTLEDAKYLRLTPQGTYQLALKMFEVGAQAVNQVDLTAVLRQYMGDIHQAMNETTHLGVRSGLEVLYINWNPPSPSAWPAASGQGSPCTPRPWARPSWPA